ncbi:MAG: hypothetical protein J2P24_17320 [Streptosporangiales bacterium]|nr:hypothetical protein [Streptosporangiales bacterium]
MSATDAATGSGLPGAQARPRMLGVLRVGVTLELAAILLQAVTAGGLLDHVAAEKTLHGTGALVVNVLGLLMLVGAILVWRPGRGPGWPAIVSAVIFAGGFAQEAFGESRMLSLHVPFGMTLMALTTWVFVWAWWRRPARATS